MKPQRKGVNKKDTAKQQFCLYHIVFFSFSKYTSSETDLSSFLTIYVSLQKVQGNSLVSAEFGYFCGPAPERESSEKSMGFPSALM